MNILAHIYLSGDNKELMFGNFIADHIKGNRNLIYTGDVHKGIALHHFIDQFTDSHPTVQQSKSRLYKTAGKYAPVISDVYFDHFLANHWKHYHHHDLEVYASEKYKQLEAMLPQAPERTQQMFPYLVKYNWLVAYRSFEGLQQVFDGMNKRAKFISHMDIAVDALRVDYGAFEEEFHQFFPELRQAVSDYLENI